MIEKLKDLGIEKIKKIRKIKISVLYENRCAAF